LQDVGRDTEVVKKKREGLGQLLTLTSVQVGVGLAVSLLGVLVARWLALRSSDESRQE